MVWICSELKKPLLNLSTNPLIQIYALESYLYSLPIKKMHTSLENISKRGYAETGSIVLHDMNFARWVLIQVYGKFCMNLCWWLLIITIDHFFGVFWIKFKLSFHIRHWAKTVLSSHNTGKAAGFLKFFWVTVLVRVCQTSFMFC